MSILGVSVDLDNGTEFTSCIVSICGLSYMGIWGFVDLLLMLILKIKVVAG